MWEHSQHPLNGDGSMARFIEDGEKPNAYDSILVSPEKLSIFGSELSVKIVKELAKRPGCAMDLARKLEEHEQKIYYHLRNLEGAGIIKRTRTEQRYGMTAKIFDVVSPIVATKLYNDGYPFEEAKTKPRDPGMAKLLHPFVKDGRMNSLVVIGDSYTHGRFNGNATEGSHMFDFALFLGTFLSNTKFPNYKLDTEVNEKDLKNNLILIGNPKTNTIIDKINENLPARFDENNDFAIVSNESGKIYNDTRNAIVLKITNPLKKDKKILLLGGTTRERGIRSAIKAFIKYTKELPKNPRKDDFGMIVRGLDMDGDKIIDDAEILERW